VPLFVFRPRSSVIISPGGLTFVIGKNLSRDLKVVKIDGKLRGDIGYRLK
jgi:hypothetical protein